MFFVNYLDRTNIGIAALVMNADLHLSPLDYGFAAGMFSLAYALCGIPANILFHKIGARKWLGRLRSPGDWSSWAPALYSTRPR